jgi:hypothetical protein
MDFKIPLLFLVFLANLAVEIDMNFDFFAGSEFKPLESLGRIRPVFFISGKENRRRGRTGRRIP